MREQRVMPSGRSTTSSNGVRVRPNQRANAAPRFRSMTPMRIAPTRTVSPTMRFFRNGDISSGYDPSKRKSSQARASKPCIRDMRLLQVISGGKLPRKPPALPSFGLISGCYLILCSILLPAEPQKSVRAPPTTRANLKQYDSAAYVIYTDVSADDAREAVLRMARMADEYRDRTKP